MSNISTEGVTLLRQTPHEKEMREMCDKIM